MNGPSTGSGRTVLGFEPNGQSEFTTVYYHVGSMARLDSLVIDSSKIRRELGLGAAVYHGAGAGGDSAVVSRAR